mmetsp:Transcript_16648/g.16329  ORF Transcript_16648/g.16329 Transcript_16648/m.16329 type:complete len:144 (-) Transcript_16648:426-857(-)
MSNISKKGKGKPMEIDDLIAQDSTESDSSTPKESRVETLKDYNLVDYVHHGNAQPETIVEKTRVVKQGKKIRKYNYKTIEISAEDLQYTLAKIRDVLEQAGEFNYEKLISEEFRMGKKGNKRPRSPNRAIGLDKNTPREMYDT